MKNRTEESLSPLFNTIIAPNIAANLLLLSPSDVGVRRNKGRNGARFAPRAVLNQLKKYNNHTIDTPFKILSVSSQAQELVDFHKSQQLSFEKILNLLETQKYKNCLHVGGGHDHIFPFLKALEATKNYDNIVVLNIDAHCDTRVEKIHHSGTPFRDFASKTKCNFHLIQLGIHDYANSVSTLTPLKNGSVEHIYLDQLKKLSNNFTKSFNFFSQLNFDPYDKKTAIVLSLDCDGIDGTSMQAVSAVNANGVPASYVQEIIEYLNLLDHQYYFGIYELNPVYENQSMLGIKTVTNLIYSYLK
jgi:formiminoglutamase